MTTPSPTQDEKPPITDANWMGYGASNPPNSKPHTSEAPDMEAARRTADFHVRFGEAEADINLARAFKALDKPPSPPNEAVMAGLGLDDVKAALLSRASSWPTELHRDVAEDMVDDIAAAVQALVEQERKACAKVADDLAPASPQRDTATKIAAAILARKP